jgi:hypothetical protein
VQSSATRIGRCSSPGPRTPLPWVTLLLIAALLALTPYAMTFDPFPGIYRFGTYKAPYGTDPLQAQRVGLVALGLCATAVAFVEGFVIFYRSPVLPSILTCVAAWFACAVVGWRSFPYWVTGVYAAYAGRVPRTDLDPKGLIPMTWLSELWRLGVILLYLLTPLVVPAAIVGSILFVRRREYVRSPIPLACSAIGLVFLFWFSPGYLIWLMD